YCATLVFNALKWNAFARVYMISFFNLMLYAYAMMFQVRTGLKLCYFATATFSFSLFRSVEWRLLVVSLIGSAFAFVAVEFGIMPGWISAIDLGDPEHPLNHAIALTALSLTIGSSLLYFAEVRNYEKKLFAASEQKSLFLSTISHEIRTPLNVIIGMTGLLGDRGLSNQEKDSYVGSIQKSSEYLLSLVNDVLDFERIEKGKVSLDLKAANIKDLFATVKNIMTPLAREKNLSLTVSYPEQAGTYYVFDGRRLSQILINFLANAIKFTGSGGVALDVTVDKEERDFCVLRFRVVDSGSGISREDQARILEPFFQVSGSSSIQPGFGLGLSIARELLRLYGAEISVQSEPGKGSIFAFSLRLEKATGASDERNREEHRLPGLHVLAADDSELNLLVLQKMLGLWDVQVTQVVNGRELVSTYAADSAKYDCVLVDSHMPLMGGVEAAHELKNRNPDLPVYLVSADATMELERAALAAGANGVITKPINVSTLYNVMLQVQKKKGKIPSPLERSMH
ncbi:MAG TPA: ATP-binding protein, partial [Leptospiraceae bacterium]|nr:ATP-binding protein [Leptospiraceae bacterium]